MNSYSVHQEMLCLYGIWRLITILTKACQIWSTLGQVNAVRIYISYLNKTQY